MFEDLDPPSFEFGRGRGETEPDEPFTFPTERERVEEEPVEREIVLTRPEDEETGPARRRLRFIPEMSETTARVVVAIPWVIFAIAIVGAGGAVFAGAMIVLGILGLREFFLMAEEERPFLLPGYAVVAGMVIAAHYG